MDGASLSPDDLSVMLQDSLRGFLAQNWTADAGRNAQPDDVSAIWHKLIGQGVASLGADPTETGLREIVVTMQELGRAGCPSPMLATALANMAFAGDRSEDASRLLGAAHCGSARLCWSFGVRDPDRNAGHIIVENGEASGLLRFV